MSRGLSTFSGRRAESSSWGGPYRGVNVQSEASAADIAAAVAAGCNLLRISCSQNPLWDKTAPFARNDANIALLDAALDACTAAGVMAVVDPHTWPGFENSNATTLPSDSFWSDTSYWAIFLAAWGYLAARYAAHPAVLAYEILNEPAPKQNMPINTASDYHALVYQAIDVIRARDPLRHIVVGTLSVTMAGVAYGRQESGLIQPPYQRPNLIYTHHTYEPHAFSHQGLDARPDNVDYPGPINEDGVTEYWDAARHARQMTQLRQFQLRTGARIWVGEVSAVRWALDNGANDYLTDLLDLFEAYGWDWCYQTWRAGSTWDAEMNGNPADTTRYASTERLDMLKAYWAMNA